nr:MAG TPA: hypothetical protein [Caudoviricetes sp.]
MIDLQNSQEAHSVSLRLKPTKRFFVLMREYYQRLY